VFLIWGCVLIDGAVVDAPKRWFNPIESAPGSVRLICLPYAGGGATAYRDWPRALPRGIQVDPVRLPGRETRVGEPPEFDVSALADAVAERIDGPYAVYGHSMGARLGFELVRELARRGVALPLRLYVAAARSPEAAEPLGAVARLVDEELIGRVTGLGGTPAEVFEVPELRALLVPVLRADFAWIDNYRYHPGPALPVPIVALAAVHDHTLPVTAMIGWQRHTAAGFRLHTVRGGHFFLTESRPQVTAILAADLLAALATPAPANARPRPLSLPEPDEAHLFRLPTGGPAGLAAVLAAYGARPAGDPDAVTDVLHPSGLRVRLTTAEDGGAGALALATRGRDDVAVVVARPQDDRTAPALRALALARGRTDPAGLSFPDTSGPGPWRATPPAPDRATHEVSLLESPRAALALPAHGVRLRYERLQEVRP
jgi:surfactin synthase thioesterase subunit